MAHDDIFDVERPKHRGAHLSRECAALLPMHVLRSDPHSRYLLRGRYQRWYRRERRDDHDFDVINLPYLRKKRFKIGCRLTVGEIHLPVRCEYFLSHDYFSVRAATPGSSFPSKS